MFAGVKGQVGVEYLTIVALMLVALAAMFMFSFSMYTDTVKIGELKNSLNALDSGITQAISLGSGTTLFADILLPSDIVSVTITGREISYTVATSGGNTDVYVTTAAENVSGSMPTTPGTHTIKIVSVGRAVELSEV